MSRVDKRLDALARVFGPPPPDPDEEVPILDDALVSRLTDAELDWLGEPLEALPSPPPGELLGHSFDGFPELELEFDRRARALHARRREILGRETWRERQQRERKQ